MELSYGDWDGIKDVIWRCIEERSYVGGGVSRTRWVRGGFGIREEGKGEGYWRWDWRIECGDGVR